MKLKDIYIPVEIKNRELDSQALLTGLLTKNGFRVYIGTHAAILSLLRSKKRKSGIYLDKGTLPIELMSMIKRNCDYVYVLDQELGPNLESTEDGQEIITERIYPETSQLIDGYLTIGPLITQYAKNYFGDSVPVHETGWPRIDIQRFFVEEMFHKEISEIQSKFGDFFLLVSNFGYLGKFEASEYKKGFGDYVKYYYSEELRKKNDDDFDLLINFLHNWNEDISLPTLVIRPHPTDNYQLWKKLTANLKKISVIRSGDITPWIAASLGVIHRGSTVATQAKIMQKKVYALRQAMTSCPDSVTLKFSDYIIEDEKFGINSFTEWENGEIIGQQLSRYIFTSDETACEIITSILMGLEGVGSSSSISRASFLKQYLSIRAIRRVLGLSQDEFRRLFGIQKYSQLGYVPWGIFPKDLKRGLAIFSPDGNYTIKKKGINLLEVTSTDEDFSAVR